MKPQTKRIGRRALLHWAATLALLAVLLPLQATAGDDGTVGGLPSADDGDGSQNFYLVGPRSELSQAIVDAYGQGFVVLVDLPGNELWIEFYGDVTLVLDEAFMDQHPEVTLGLSAGFNGGGMQVLPVIDGVPSGRRLFVAMGRSMETAYDDFKEFLGGSFSLLTWQVSTFQRAEMSYAHANGLLSVTQQF